MLTSRVCTLLGLVLLVVTTTDADVEQSRFFESQVRPILASKCVGCHGAEKQRGNLRLDSREAVLKGGESGVAVVPGEPAESLLIDAINHGSLEMPPDEKLGPIEIDVLTRWVLGGAVWPRVDSALIRSSPKEFTQQDRNWWAIQPVREPDVPTESIPWGREWAVNEIDAFIARRLDDSGLSPAKDADRYEMIRRATFDLHGLPPTPQQIDRFVNDQQPNAWERLIDRLLDSPRYGERWAQHWLDVVRYADSDGYNEDAFRPNAGHFRDYVISSLNDDKPYKQLVREHLAGDEIAPEDPNIFVGTAFLRHGIYEWNQRNVRMHWDLIVHEMTRVTGEAFLGIGIGCAQCHDHKFDPILQKDYLGLQAFLASVSWPEEKPLATPQAVADYQKKLRAWEAATQSIRDEMHELGREAFDSNQEYIVGQFHDDIQAIYHKPDSEKPSYEKQLTYLVRRQAKRAANRFDFEKSLKSKPEKLARYQALKAELKEFAKLKPTPLPDAFVATDIARDPTPTYLQTRTTREIVEPAFLTLLSSEPPKITATATTTGRRTALANWISQDDNPLSTRVIVNRVWQHHFGAGIVATPNDFGTLGDPPSHPELLDWLTRRFVEGGWRIKWLHKLIMTSATYRQTARREPSDDETQTDPNNRLLWRFSPQRLDAEQVRDAMLAVSGELKHRSGGKAISGTAPYRSVYVKRMRNRPDEMLSGFDAPLCFESAPNRIATTTPIQSLLLINGDWTLGRSQAFAKRLLDEKKQVAAADVRHAFQLAFGREALPNEVGNALSFIQAQAIASKGEGQSTDSQAMLAAVTDFCHAIFNSNEFLYLH